MASPDWEDIYNEDMPSAIYSQKFDVIYRISKGDGDARDAYRNLVRSVLRENVPERLQGQVMSNRHPFLVHIDKHFDYAVRDAKEMVERSIGEELARTARGAQVTGYQAWLSEYRSLRTEGLSKEAAWERLRETRS